MGLTGYKTASVDGLMRADGWAPIRRSLGIQSFGTNAWRGAEAGDDVIDEHVELSHEELYLVIEGHALFKVDGNEIDAPRGTLVLVSDPALWRSAVAVEPDTVVLTMGGDPGEPFQANSWEVNRDVLPLFEKARFSEAKSLLLAAMEEYGDPSGLLYNLACADSQLGNYEDALNYLRQAVTLRSELGQLALEDEDLMPLRDDPRFAELTG